MFSLRQDPNAPRLAARPYLGDPPGNATLPPKSRKSLGEFCQIQIEGFKTQLSSQVSSKTVPERTNGRCPKSGDAPTQQVRVARGYGARCKARSARIETLKLAAWLRRAQSRVLRSLNRPKRTPWGRDVQFFAKICGKAAGGRKGLMR